MLTRQRSEKISGEKIELEGIVRRSMISLRWARGKRRRTISAQPSGVAKLGGGNEMGPSEKDLSAGGDSLHFFG